MKEKKIKDATVKYSREISNYNYIELLEKYILFDKLDNLDNKHKEWSKVISE